MSANEEDKKPAADGVHINLKVQNLEGNEVFFRIKRNTQLKKLMNAYCDRQSVEINSIAFLFDGRRLRAEQTPDELEMEDGDEIDAMLHQTAESSSVAEDLPVEDLVKVVAEKDELLKTPVEKIKDMLKQVLTLADSENLMQREAENSKKFAVQSFAKSLLDVADNLSRASSVVKESFVKIDASQDSAGAVPLLKTLLEGVEMTEKQLAEVFKKFGVEKYDPTDEQFDPNRHNAVLQVPDSTKPADRVAVVLKAGYMLNDRILRPAEVGVTIAADEKDENKESET